AVIDGEIRQHRFEHARVDRGRGLVVEIDRRGVGARGGVAGGHMIGKIAHAARARPCVRRCNAVQASMKWAISASVVDQPRLTRIVTSAIAGPMPMAASTWLEPTLPDEQAAPA